MVIAANQTHPPVQRLMLALAAVAASGLFGYLLGFSGRLAALFMVGLGLGVSLYHATFGFTGAYRRAILDKDITGVSAQLAMLAVAIILFAPVLAGGGSSGALAPVSVSMAFGAFLFGIGMQFGGGCASGTLFSVGGGNIRMIVVLIFFCAGTFWGSLDLHWWARLPGIGVVSLGDEFGWAAAVAMQLALLALIYLGLRLIGCRNKGTLWAVGGFHWRNLFHGPWPLLMAAGFLALGNWATLLIAGRPWNITWAFSLWSAKTAVWLGWEPATSPFWSGGFQQAALARTALADITSVMNIAIVVGALAAAALAGKLSLRPRIPLKPLMTAVLGGLMMGYGARLAYGCNIGAFFSGVASSSLHGWVWILFAVPGNIIGLRLRSFLRLK